MLSSKLKNSIHDSYNLFDFMSLVSTSDKEFIDIQYSQTHVDRLKKYAECDETTICNFFH